MMRLDDEARQEQAAVREIVLLLRARDEAYVRMELWDFDVWKAVYAYAEGERVHDSKIHRMARDFRWLVKSENELAAKYLPRRKNES